MRKPARPPAVDLSFLTDLPDFGMRLAAIDGPLVKGRYVHWDKLRRLQPPHALSREQWWSVIKLRRQTSTRAIGLSSVDGRPFRFTQPDATEKLLHDLTRDAAGQILIDEKITSPPLRDRYVIRSLVEEAITSSQIEGAATTRAVAKEMLRTKRRPRTRDERMIANNFRAMEHLRMIAAEPISKSRLLGLHRMLTEDTLDDPTGVARFRRADESVTIVDNDNQVLHEPPPADQLESRFEALCDFANGATPSYFIHPAIRAIIVHFWLAYDHPFVDGNGRCARGLFYWVMLRNGYWLTEFLSISTEIKKSQARYGRAFLYTETDDNDLTYFILYHLDLIDRAIETIRGHLKRKMGEAKQVEDLARTLPQLNHRQVELLNHAVRHEADVYSFGSHAREYGTVYQTARTDLLGLVDLGLLRSSRRGKAYEFRPAADLVARLKRSPDPGRDIR